MANTFLIKLKFITINSLAVIWSSPLSIAISSICFFLISLFGFSFIYWFIFQWQSISTVSHEGKAYTGRLFPTPAFSFSESFKTTLKINAANDLRLTRFGDQFIQVTWMGFSEDKSIYRQFGNDPETPDQIKIVSRLGTTPIQLIEEKFEKYAEMKIKMTFIGHEQRNTNADRLLIPIMQEYFREPSAEAMSNRVFGATMTQSELKLFAKLQIAISTLSNRVFSNQETTLGNLRNAIIGAFEELNKNESFEDQKRLKSIFYGEILNSLSIYNVKINFDFESLFVRPRFIDFLYMSTMVATNNVPSEITPITDNVRFLIWVQMMISYFNLAFIVAAILRILNL